LGTDIIIRGLCAGHSSEKKETETKKKQCIARREKCEFQERKRTEDRELLTTEKEKGTPEKIETSKLSKTVGERGWGEGNKGLSAWDGAFGFFFVKTSCGCFEDSN